MVTFTKNYTRKQKICILCYNLGSWVTVFPHLISMLVAFENKGMG